MVDENRGGDDAFLSHNSIVVLNLEYGLHLGINVTPPFYLLLDSVEIEDESVRLDRMEEKEFIDSITTLKLSHF